MPQDAELDLGSGHHAGRQQRQEQGGDITSGGWRRRARRLGCAGAVIALAAGARTTAALAARCPAPAGASPRLADVDGGARLAWIDARLTSAGNDARLWAWGWGGGIAASGVASLAVVPFVSAEDRVDWYTSAASAAIGVLPFIFSPLEVARDSRELHAEVAGALAAERADQVCPVLADAEARLARDADNQRRQQAWWLHAGNLAFNTGVLLFLGLGFHHWEAGIINGASGAAVGEAIIFTQPTATIDDLRAYRAADLAPATAATWSFATTF